MTGGGQLTFDGREVPMKRVAAERRLTEANREALAHVARDGQIRTAVAGRIVHQLRGHCARRADYSARAIHERPAAQCCAYCCADGFSMMRRLETAGLVVHVGRGRWAARLPNDPVPAL